MKDEKMKPQGRLIDATSIEFQEIYFPQAYVNDLAQSKRVAQWQLYF